MQIDMKPLPRMTLEEFADRHGLTMEVAERHPCDWSAPGHFQRYYAHFKSAEVKEGNILKGVFGNGSTTEEAIENYAREISRKRLVLDAYKGTRRELEVPCLEKRTAL